MKNSQKYWLAHSPKVPERLENEPPLLQPRLPVANDDAWCSPRPAGAAPPLLKVVERGPEICGKYSIMF